jgi:hypothetical protein
MSYGSLKWTRRARGAGIKSLGVGGISIYQQSNQPWYQQRPTKLPLTNNQESGKKTAQFPLKERKKKLLKACILCNLDSHEHYLCLTGNAGLVASQAIPPSLYPARKKQQNFTFESWYTRTHHYATPKRTDAATRTRPIRHLRLGRRTAVNM